MSTANVHGTPGATGAGGSYPGGAGGAGTAGGPASASNSSAAYRYQTALAYGGAGGAGGGGGPGTSSGGRYYGPGGAGGNGAAGGQATANCTNLDNYALFTRGDANAYGGAGGHAGPGGGGAPYGLGGTGGAGGYAYANTFDYNAGGPAIAQAKATGGAGGKSYGAASGGAGGGATATAYAYSLAAGQNATADVSAIGGAGGYGAYTLQTADANGGAGGNVALNNAVKGYTYKGDLTLSQIAKGGAGGGSEYGAPGNGGSAMSLLSFNDLFSAHRSASMHGYTDAYGGAGGSGGSVGANGGQANATLVLTTSGAATGIVHAFGGAGATAGTGGTGKALLSLYGTDITAAAKGIGGAGAIAGHSSAKIKSGGTSGTFSAYAATAPVPGQLIETASASSTGTVDGRQNSKAKVVIGQPAQPLEAQGQAVALESAAPSTSSTNAILAANPTINSALGASPSFFAVDEFGGSYAKSGGTTSETTTETVNLTVDLTKLASRQNLVAGFCNATVSGSGFTSLTFTLIGDGVTLVSKTFTTVADAQAFFTNNAISLGSLTSGALSGNTLTLQASFSLTAEVAGQGFWAQMIIGDPPPAASGSQLFAQAMAAMGGRGGGLAPALGSGVAPNQPMLAMSRMAA